MAAPTTPFLALLAIAAALSFAGSASAIGEDVSAPLGRVIQPTPIDVEIPTDLGAPGGEIGIDAVALDGAGTELRDAGSGGPSASRFVHLESDSVCGAPCRVSAANDELLAIVPPSGSADFPWRWASGLVTQGVAGGGYSQATLWVDTNGHIAFQDPVVPHPVRATSVPNVAAPNALVAANWQDLDPSATSGVAGIYVAITGVAPNRVIYIEWWNVPNALDSTCTQQFEIALYESNYAAEVYYLTSCNTFAATGGEESSGGAVGLLYFNGAVPQNTGVRYRDVRAPGGATQTVACAVPGNSGWCKSNDATVTFSDTEDKYSTQIGTGVKSRVYRVDAGTNLAYTRGVAIPLSLPEGQHTMTINVADWAGNTGVAVFGRPDIDLTPPTASAGFTCSLPGTDGWCRSSVGLGGTSSDAVSGIAFRTCLMDSVVRSCGGTYSTQGTHAWSVHTGDRAGWTTSTSAFVKVDTVAPVPSLAQSCTLPGTNGWCRGELTVVGSGSDATSGVVSTACKLDGVASDCSAAVPEGTHVFSVTLVDGAGNTGSASWTLNVDTLAPEASASFACGESVNGFCVTPTVAYSAGGSDAGSGPASSDCLLDGEAASCSGEVATDGTHTIEVTVLDLAGNSASASDTITLDAGAPVVTLDLACATTSASGWCLDASFSYLATATDTLGVVSFECALDGAVAPCEGSASGEGSHSVTATASDGAEHVTTQTAAMSIDSIAPEVTTTLEGLEGDNGWHRSAVTVSLACADATSGVSTLEVSVDGGEFAAYTEAFEVSEEGDTEVVARCRDVAGHETLETTVVRIDTIAPTAALTTTPYAADAYDVLWSAADGGSGVATVVVEEALLFDALDQGYAAVCTVDVSDTPAEAEGACERDPNPGLWCYRVVVRDAAGNEHVTARADPESAKGLEGELAKCTLKATPGELPQAAMATVRPEEILRRYLGL